MPSAADSDVVIRILTAFEKGGIEEAKKAAGVVKTAYGETSEKAGQAAAATDLLSRSGAQGAASIRALVSAAKGGPGAFSALESGVRGLFGALSSGGGVLLAVQAAVATIGALVGDYKAKLAEAEAAAGEAARAAEEAAAALQQHVAAANKASLARLRDEYKSVGEAAEDAARKARALSDASAAEDDAALGLQLAQLDLLRQGESDPSRLAAIDLEKAQLKNAAAARRLEADTAAADRRGALSANVRAAQEQYDERQLLLAGLRRSVAESGNDAARDLYERTYAVRHDPGMSEGARVGHLETLRQETDAADQQTRHLVRHWLRQREALEQQSAAAWQLVQEAEAAREAEDGILRAQMRANELRAKTVEVLNAQAENAYKAAVAEHLAPPGSPGANNPYATLSGPQEARSVEEAAADVRAALARSAESLRGSASEMGGAAEVVRGIGGEVSSLASSLRGSFATLSSAVASIQREVALIEARERNRR